MRGILLLLFRDAGHYLHWRSVPLGLCCANDGNISVSVFPGETNALSPRQKGGDAHKIEKRLELVAENQPAHSGKEGGSSCPPREAGDAEQRRESLLSLGKIIALTPVFSVVRSWFAVWGESLETNQSVLE